MPLTPLLSEHRLCDYASFSDESCSDGNHRYMVIGGILCRTNFAHELAAEIDAIHRAHNFREAIEWKSLSRAKLVMYERVVDLFFEHNRARRVDLTCH